MSFKKLIVTWILAIFMIAPGFTGNYEPSTIKGNNPPTETPATVRSKALLSRLEEISAMDIKAMSKAEKKALRKEVKSIRKEMRALKGDGLNDGGVYISVGGIIIILLLILLL